MVILYFQVKGRIDFGWLSINFALNLYASHYIRDPTDINIKNFYTFDCSKFLGMLIICSNGFKCNCSQCYFTTSIRTWTRNLRIPRCLCHLSCVMEWSRCKSSHYLLNNHKTHNTSTLQHNNPTSSNGLSITVIITIIIVSTRLCHSPMPSHSQPYIHNQRPIYTSSYGRIQNGPFYSKRKQGYHPTTQTRRKCYEFLFFIFFFL